MFILSMLFLAIPVVFLFVSVVLATKSFEKGNNAKRSVLIQLASFAFVFALCFVCPMVASAATGETVANTSALADGLKYIGAALATGISCIGGGIAVGKGAPAAIGATAEEPKNFGKSIIFVALGEGIALYGMLISIMILGA